MDQDFLTGVTAIQLGLATPEQVRQATTAWLQDQSQNIVDRLEASGVLDKTKRAMLEQMVVEAVKVHDGDVQKTLHTLGGDNLLLQSFGGSLMVNADGEVSLAPEGAEGDDSESGEVTTEHEGRYALKGGSSSTAEIGRGGLGRVLLAFDEHLGRDVALKELLDGGGSTMAEPTRASRTTAVVSRFLREARVTGQLEHPNIVPVHEVGRRADGTYYYSMRVVRGRTLGDKLGEAKTLVNRLSLLTHYENVCNAIAYAHSRGVVHRDIKPDNVMIGEFGETVVLDWGLAKVEGQEDIRSNAIKRDLKLMHDAGAGQTIDGSAVGTPAYMSPEQAEGNIDEIDERSDVWGLGAVLYELLTGRPPFEGVMPYEILGKVISNPVKGVRTLAPDVPPELAAVAEKALSRERSERYPTAKELANEIEAYLQGQRVGAYAYSSWELVRRFIVKNKALSLGVAAVLVTLIASSIVVFSAWGREQKARALADEQKAAAIEQRKEATINLAQAYVGGAEEQLRERDYGAAYVVAAAALREYQRTDTPLEGERRVALESALYQAKVRRTFALERTYHNSTNSRIRTFDLSPDGQLFALGYEDQTVLLYSLEHNRPPVRRIVPRLLHQVAFTPDGKQLLIAQDGKLSTHAVSDLSQVSSEDLKHSIAVEQFSPDRTRVIVSDAKRITSLHWRGGKQAPVVLGAGDAVFSPDGLQIARLATNGLLLYDGETGAELRTLPVKEKGFARAFSRDGKRIVVETMTGQSILDLASGKVVAQVRRTSTNIHHVARFGQGFLFGRVDRAELWDGQRSALTEILWKEPGPLAVTASKDDRRLVVASAAAVRVWALRQRERARSVPSADAPLNVAFSSAGDKAVLAAHGRVTLVDLGETVRSTLVSNVPTSNCTDAAITPDGRRVVLVGTDQVIKLHNVEQKKELTQRRLTGLNWFPRQCSSVEYGPKGKRIFVTAPDGRIHVLHPDTLALDRILGSVLQVPPTLRFSTDGRLLFLGDYVGQVAAWDAKSLRFLRRRTLPGVGYVSDLTTTLDGKTLITAGKDGWVRRFHMGENDWTPALAQQAHDAWVNRVALSPDGKVLLTTSDDYTAKQWATETGKLLRVHRANKMVGAVAFSPVGASFALGDGDALTFFPDLRDLVELDGSTLFEDAKQETGRSLSGFTIKSTGERKPPDSTDQKNEWKVASNEWKGKVVGFAGGALPPTTQVELIRVPDGVSFSPRIAATINKSSSVTFRVPDDVKTFGVRVTAGNEITNIFSRKFRPGMRGNIGHYSKGATASLAARVGVKLQEGSGHLAAAVVWQANEDLQSIVAVGCAEVLVDGNRVYYQSPAAFYPDPRLDRTYPAWSYFYAFNLPPGERDITVRVGKVVMKRKLLVQAGTVTLSELTFDPKNYPEDPTPPDCMADWSPK
jgi:eukaryotic-like serine/threonine-protein kinase